ncbi:MAG TPA: DNA translocase FtsK [Anaerolinea thermolimosa]|uniref:DNA translocase FtsK n=1 Tax=Anaerolinea thermolimosa TaxID=229919 RepID=A0A3D1JDA1_9CHLR|nr:DNA translocase FtsK [Anaerolinea thermolimosa]GAP07208.1 DNA segregation ATPase FtsK [Anaerolinea thermolimosa]HCE16559.1 DNA translocase FtsK [Anaerolinea thermolimosa]
MPKTKHSTPLPKGKSQHRSAGERTTSKRQSSKNTRSSAHRRGGGQTFSPTRPGWWSQLSAERKLDLLGILLAFAGFLSLLSLLSKEHGVLTRWWVTVMRQVGGHGAFILPVAALLSGIWLVLRKIERIPAPSAERLAGFFLLYTNFLTILHLAFGGGWEMAAAGNGGGYIGAFFERMLVSGLGNGGAWVVVITWLVLGIAFVLDISINDLASAVSRAVASLTRSKPSGSQVPQPRSVRRVIPDEPEVEAGSSELPPDFIPLQPLKETGTKETSSSPTPRVKTRETPMAGGRSGAEPSKPAPSQSQEPEPPRGPAWALPPLDEILDPPSPEVIKSTAEQERARLIEETLASFGAPAHVVEIHHGPTVTQYGVEPDFVESRSGRMRVRVSKIVSLADDLALALAAPRIRIQAPVPGRSYVGIEVPNVEVSRVKLREVMESEAFKKINSPLRIAIGKDVAGKPVAYDLTAMPHLLIAGTTGSGKSVCVNALLTCLLIQNSPNELRLILVDPKRVELTGYNGIPHLLAPVVVDAERVVGALQWVQREMDARYHRFSQVGVRNIAEYNRKNTPGLPYLVVLVDELADLMMLAPDETERSLTRLAQLARATGIHLVLATQRPSVDVVTGLIKANFPARIAFAVASGIDSRVILDQPGAERLLGRGDMLFQAPDAPAPVRLQGVHVADTEIQRLVDFWKIQDYNLRLARQAPAADGTAEPVRMDLPLSTPLTQAPLFDEELGSKSGDPLLEEAIRIVREEGRASISMLQRKLRIGYTRAARLIDAMEDQGIVGPAQPTSQVREVLQSNGDDQG